MRIVAFFLAAIFLTGVARVNAEVDVAALLMTAAQKYAEHLNNGLAFTDQEQPSCIDQAIDPRSGGSFRVNKGAPLETNGGSSCLPWTGTLSYDKTVIGSAKVEAEPSQPVVVNVTTTQGSEIYPEDIVRREASVEMAETIKFTQDFKIEVDMMNEQELWQYLQRDAIIQVDPTVAGAQQFSELLAGLSDQKDASLSKDTCYTVKTTRANFATTLTVPFRVQLSGNLRLHFRNKVALDLSRASPQTVDLDSTVFFPDELVEDDIWSVPIQMMMEAIADLGISDLFTIHSEPDEPGVFLSGNLVFYNTDAHYHADFDPSCPADGSQQQPQETGGECASICCITSCPNQ